MVGACLVHFLGAFLTNFIEFIVSNICTHAKNAINHVLSSSEILAGIHGSWPSGNLVAPPGCPEGPPAVADVHDEPLAVAVEVRDVGGTVAIEIPDEVASVAGPSGNLV